MAILKQFMPNLQKYRYCYGDTSLTTTIDDDELDSGNHIQTPRTTSANGYDQRLLRTYIRQIPNEELKIFIRNNTNFVHLLERAQLLFKPQYVFQR